MNLFDSYKDEIVESINKISEQQEITNKILLEDLQDIEKTSGDVEFKIQAEEVELNEEELEITEVLTEGTEVVYEEIFIQKLEEFIAVNESLEEELINLNETQVNNSGFMVEGFWLLAIIVVASIGFKIFFDNILKW